MAQFRRIWDSVKEVSAHHIEEEANKSFRIALVGAPECTLKVFEKLLGPNPIPEQSETAALYVLQLEEMPSEGYSTVLLCGNSVSAESLVEELIKRLPDYHVAMARRLPGLRSAVCKHLIHITSVTNAQIALMTAIPSVIPIAGLFLPAAADTIVLTKNQLILLMRIAASYGETASWGKRWSEMMPIIGGAFGWRAIARELAGAVPGGVGIGVKGAIAYSGTYVAGMGALTYFAYGRGLSREEQKELFARLRTEAFDTVRGIIQKVPTLRPTKAPK